MLLADETAASITTNKDSLLAVDIKDCDFAWVKKPPGKKKKRSTAGPPQPPQDQGIMPDIYLVCFNECLRQP